MTLLSYTVTVLQLKATYVNSYPWTLGRVAGTYSARRPWDTGPAAVTCVEVAPSPSKSPTLAPSPSPSPALPPMPPAPMHLRTCCGNTSVYPGNFWSKFLLEGPTSWCAEGEFKDYCLTDTGNSRTGCSKASFDWDSCQVATELLTLNLTKTQLRLKLDLTTDVLLAPLLCKS